MENIEDQDSTTLLDPMFGPVLLFDYKIETLISEDEDEDEHGEDEDGEDSEGEHIVDQDDEFGEDNDSLNNDGGDDVNDDKSTERVDDNTDDELDEDDKFGEENDNLGGNSDGGDDVDDDKSSTKRMDDDDDDDTSDEHTEEVESNTVFFYGINTRQLLPKTTDEFSNYLHWVTPQGWLLMEHVVTDETFLWSPFTNQRIRLPDDHDNFLVVNVIRCLLSHKPTDPNCVVLVVSYTDTILWYCYPGGDQWFQHKYQPSMIHEDTSFAIKIMVRLASVEGKFYSSTSGKIVKLEFSPKPTFTTLPVCEEPNENYFYTFLDRCSLESSGVLFRLSFNHPVTCAQKVAHVEVHKLDLSRGIWVQVETIGNKVFLVDSDCIGTSLNAEEVGLKRNCIYSVRSRDKGLYVYDMERGTTALHNPGQDLPDNVAPKIVIPPC